MSRAWFADELETVVTFWRILRRDGVTLGFVSHDRDISFAGVVHRAAPGMVPSAIRLSAGLDSDSADIQGALSHDAIDAEDLSLGRFDGAQVLVGLVDWISGENEVIYTGKIGAVSRQDNAFTAELISGKADLDRDSVPRTSPMCRAQFCGPGCGLSAALFTHEAVAAPAGPASLDGAVAIICAVPAEMFVGGLLRWVDGPLAGLSMAVIGAAAGQLILDQPMPSDLPSGLRVSLRQGCDHRLDTCSNRFGNAVSFQGEPFLPGNDLVTRYPTPVS